MSHPAQSVFGRRQGGSTFVMVLMALVIITFLGISLAFITEIEMQLGGTERTISQNFYGSEAGVQAPIAGLIITQDWAGEQFAFIEKDLGDRLLGRRITTSRIHLVGTPRPAPMTIANEGESPFNTVSIYVRATSERISWPDDGTGVVPPIFPAGDPREDDVTVQAQNVVETRYYISPLKGNPPGPEAYYDGTDASPVIIGQ